MLLRGYIDNVKSGLQRAGASPGAFANWQSNVGGIRRTTAGGLKQINRLLALAAPFSSLPQELQSRVELLQRKLVLPENAFDYRGDMPAEVISIIQSTSSIEELGQLLENIAREVINFGGKIKPEALHHFELISILFGFESNPYDILESMASRFKNLQVSAADQDLITREFYTGTDPYDVETAYVMVLRTLKDMPQDPRYTFDGRIKQPRSLILKLGRALAKLKGAPLQKPLTVAELFAGIRSFGPTIAADPAIYFDDLVGFKFIINDLGMDVAERTAMLTYFAELIKSYFNPLAREGSLHITQERKESCVPGFEKANLYLQDWLDHPVLGALPIKIQFRFLKAMCIESAMYYTYKRYGIWTLPPWAKGIDFDRVTSFEQLQRMLYANFKKHFTAKGHPFDIREVLTPSPGWAFLFDTKFSNTAP